MLTIKKTHNGSQLGVFDESGNEIKYVAGFDIVQKPGDLPVLCITIVSDGFRFEGDMSFEISGKDLCHVIKRRNGD